MSEAIVGDRRQQRLNLGLGVGRGRFVRLVDPIDEFGNVATNDALGFGDAGQSGADDGNRTRVFSLGS